jgi:phosphatidylglycerophosphatase A
MIFSFFEKKKPLDIKSLKVDLHSHLIVMLHIQQ